MRLCCVAILGLLLAPGIRGDSPMGPPIDWVACSGGDRYCVRSQVDPPFTIGVESLASGAHKELWRIEQWFRWAWLSTDGTSLATTPWQTLVPRMASTDLVVLRVWCDGVLTTEATLGDVIESMDSLQPTVSHNRWGNVLGFDPAGMVVLETVENRTLHLAPCSAKGV